MKKFLLITFLASTMIFTGCTGGYSLYDKVSPNLTDLKNPDDFFTNGFELNHDISVNAADNLAAHL